MSVFYEKLNSLLSAHTPFVAVTMVDATGSVPQEPGTKMLVTADGLYYGTVGGGKVENRAIQEAQAMLYQPDGAKTRFVEWNLNRDIGMTCGGTVRLYFERHQAGDWTIAIFGAGHVAQALVRLLLPLDCRVLCIDPRPPWLAQLPEAPNLTRIAAVDMPAQVKDIPEGAFVVLMTMGHSTDKPILLEILRTRQFPYLGVIGSRAKAARLRKDVREAGLSEACEQSFYCPIGLDVGGNDPQEIAISVAAQLLQVRDRLQSTQPLQNELSGGNEEHQGQ